MSNKRKTEAIWVPSQNRWRIRVTVKGKTKPFYSPTPGRRGKIEAERAADEWLDNGGSDDPRFEVVWAAYLQSVADTHKEKKESPAYIKYESMGRLHLLPRLKLMRISAITCADWQECITAAYNRGLAHKTCSNVRGAITAFYRYAKKARIRMESPDMLEIPKDAPKGKRKILQPDGLRLLFTIDHITAYRKPAPCFYIHAWRFFVLTGLRRGELCGLRREDIVDNILYIRRSINSRQQETSGKNENATRYIVLSERMLAILDAQAEHLRKQGIISPWVFPSEDGNQTDTNRLYKKWYTYRNQHKLESSLHELRHTMVSIVKSDVPESLMKSVVGHSESMDTYGTYGHQVDDDARRASKMINDVFDRIFDSPIK